MTKPTRNKPGKPWAKPQQTHAAPDKPAGKRQPKKLRLTIRPK